VSREEDFHFVMQRGCSALEPGMQALLAVGEIETEGSV
jgi:hypothetical protein